MNRFDGKVALVSGAASGIGAAVVARLAEEGAAVVGFDRTAIDGGVQGDVSDPDDCARAVATVLDRHGRLDVLANVAGIGATGPTVDFPLAEWERVLAVNLTGTFLLSQAALPALLASGGNIVNMASASGLRGTPYNAAYCASKGGVVMLTKSMAVELASQGVRVNAVCPGGVDTPLLAQFQGTAGAEEVLRGRRGSLYDRLIRPDEVAAAVAYLASDDAAAVTGTAFSIDAGATA